ncbi:MAG: HAD-IIB family hydrolase [Campylobacterales bacterium]|nr:HAD-IIB family hydrolase [Campylobacterales bacterium]
MKSPVFLTDLDHTFLRSDQSVSPFSRDVWNRIARHTPLTVATARSFSKSHDLLNALHLDAPMILLDGSMVVLPDKTPIDIKTIGKEIGDELIEAGRRFDIIEPFIIGLTDRDLNEAFRYPENVTPMQLQVLENYRKDPRLERLGRMEAMEETLKIVYMAEEARLRPLTEHFRQLFGDALEFKLSPEKYTGGYYLTILHPLGDKAHAMAKVAEYLEHDTADFTVFGDSLNDLGMFELAGTACAVQNALDEVKAAADIVLPHTNDEDAVARYLQEALHA